MNLGEGTYQAHDRRYENDDKKDRLDQGESGLLARPGHRGKGSLIAVDPARTGIVTGIGPTAPTWPVTTTVTTR